MLDVCCNDPDNGHFDGKAYGLSVGSIELEPLRSPCRFVLTDRGFRLAGKEWPTTWSKDWVGNWCWNRYRISDGRTEYAVMLARFMFWLKGRKLYTCISGPDEFFLWFDDRFKEHEFNMSRMSALLAEEIHGK
jgi:hypothetical protein